MEKNKTKKMAGIAIFTALVVILQLLCSFIKTGIFSITLCLVPMVVGAAVYGVGAGAWLGFVFGLVVLLSGDAAAFLTVNPVGTVLTVLLKGTLAGLCAGLVYRWLEKKNQLVAVAAAALVSPIVNTGVFLLGCVVFFLETVSGWAANFGFGENVGAYMIFGLVGVNILLELAVNVICVPIIVRIIKIGKRN